MQGKAGRERDVEQYLEEGLLALLPFYEGDAGRTMVHTLQGEHRDRRSTGWLVQRIATYYHLDLGELRRRCGRLLNQRHHITLPLTSALVLLPVRARSSRVLGETTMGYLSLLQVERILPAEGAGGAEPREDGRGARENSAHVSSAAAPPASSPVSAPTSALPASPTSAPPASPASSFTSAPASSPMPFLSRVLFKNGLQLGSLNTAETLEERLRQGHLLRRETRGAGAGAGAQFIGAGAEDFLELLPSCQCVLKDIFVRIIKGKGG